MLTNNVRVVCLSGVLLAALSVLNSQPVNSTMTVPRTVRYAGFFRPVDGLPTQSMEGVTISVYRDQTGGDPLWQETQNAQVDPSGNFVVKMGATLNEGLPLDLLRKGEPRWVGVRINRPGEAEQPRVQMLSVPYALRASDAETLGGIPASAYLVNPSVPGAAAATSGPASANAVKPRVTAGSSNYLGLFTNPTDLGNSVLYQNGGKIGLNTVNPLDYLHVAFNDATGNFTGYSVQNLGGGASSYSGMLFYDQNGALANFQGFNNLTHEYRINNIASNGSINFMLGGASKLQVQNNGDINIAGGIQVGGTRFIQSIVAGNMGVGLNALSRGNPGGMNTAVGYEALEINSGSSNAALGFDALRMNTTGAGNAAVGTWALLANTGGLWNTAIGALALSSNSVGNQNAAIGYGALQLNTFGDVNTALGTQTLQANTIGFNNTGAGFGALLSNTTGNFNAAFGDGALGNNTTGSSNIALGHFAGINNTSGSSSLLLGNEGTSSDDHIIRIGDVQTKAFIAGIRGITTGAGDAINVVIDSNGQLGTINSSRRFKEDIQDMGDASTNLLRLRPVTYHYRQPYLDGSKPQDYGLIAEEVAEVYPDLVGKSKDGQVETVQYQKLTPMLLNELQKQAELIRKLEARLAALESTAGR